MKKIRLGLFPNMQIERVKDEIFDVVQACRQHEIEPVLPNDLALCFKAAGYDANTGEGLAELDAGVSLGGDGSFLRMAHQTALYSLPIFGINFGHLGFLAEVELRALPHALKNLARRNFKLETHYLLRGEVIKNGKVEQRELALNEFVVNHKDSGRVARTGLFINGSPSGRYVADGLIVATSTGSTAYSLSAGGPLVQPELDVVIITPVAAHSLSARPLVIPSSEQLEIRLLGKNNELVLSSDGHKVAEIDDTTVVKIRKSEVCVRFIRLTERSYYETWQQKLMRDM